MKTEFNVRGFAYRLVGVQDGTGDGGMLAGKVLWEADEVDAEGRTLRHHTGNGVQSIATFDPGERGSGDKKEMEMSVVRNSFPFFRLTPFPLWVGAW